MKLRIQIIMSIIFALALTTGVGAAELTDQIKTNVLTAAEDGLKKKTIQSGTLDIFDEEANRVRNLRAIKTQEDITAKEGKYLILIDYRDITSGDIVKVEVEVAQTGEDFTVEGVRIKSVQKLDKGTSQEAKEYTDEEIQTFMHDYFNQQTRFTDGIVMLFDKNAERMRNLKLTELTTEVRRLGIFYSSSAQMEDNDNGDILKVDVSVKNEKGTLKVQALRIRDVRKAPSPN